MASVCDYAKAKLKIDEETRHSMEGMFDPLTLDGREIYYEKSGEDYYPQILFSYSDETLQLKRKDVIYEFTVRNQFELEAILPDGEVTWFKGTDAPYEGCGELEDGGHYTENYHESEDILIRVIDKEAKKIIRYKVIKESELPLASWEEKHFFPEPETKPEYKCEEQEATDQEVKEFLDSISTTDNKECSSLVIDDELPF